MDATGLENDRKTLDGFLSNIAEKEEISAESINEALFLFEQFECWGPYFTLIKKCLKNPGTRKTIDYINLARVQNLYLEDVFSAAETCTLLVTEMKISNKIFTEEVLPKILEEEDYTAESSIRNTVWNQFESKVDKVSCLERLCLLYEKKTHSDVNLAETYETLLGVDSDNVKALRYFKLVYAQNNEWEEVVNFLNRILACVKHKSEKYRVAQELSVIFLYQLDKPQDAILTIETHCNQSPLDTSTILYDAYHRIGKWQGCLGVLRECLLSAEDETARAVLHFKIGGILETLDEQEDALENFQKAAVLWPEFIDAYEGAIGMALKLQKFDLVLTWMQKIEKNLFDKTLIDQIQQASKRLKDGMEQAANA
jgi:tetratricopeptide (TPR) repeat protein